MKLKKLIIYIVCCLLPLALSGQTKNAPSNSIFEDANLPSAAGPWVFWYWMHASFSREGITADLEAMKEVGIAGAYLAPIKGKTNPPLFEPVIETLTPEWWELVKFTFQEADRIGIKIALLPNDGFATAGGPWITPELAMQKLVWSETYVRGGRFIKQTLPQPESYEGYYNDIAVYAFPAGAPDERSSYSEIPQISTSNGMEADFLNVPGNKQNFSTVDPAWIQYEFEEPFTCNTIKIDVNNSNHQANRLIIEVSDDGEHFKKVARLQPPRSGWLDWDAGVTHTIEPVTARYFRFVYDPAGTEPGSEDLDAAKWKQSLKITGISLLSSPRIHQFEGKSGMIWRVSPRTTPQQIPDRNSVSLTDLIDISEYVNEAGVLQWNAPPGNWTILRMGHTATGHKNETAGAGKGLECDKLNPDVVRLQFNGWFMKAKESAGPELAARVLSVFHVDSWESGSQNWSPVFRNEFIARRGYDPLMYLPAMAGIPVGSADLSERFLYDIRKTISELMTDNFFTVLKELAHQNGALFTSETTAPVMAADGLIHFREVDVPMGEFWLNSPSHDKPNDILDAISASRIYGKPIVQAEAFTQIRMQWNEHPGNLKTLQDRNYALGINNLVYHVFTHNPWMDRKPGMTLDGVGLYFQRDQTWWKPGKAWVTYAKRNHALLQQGKAVADIAVFIGEEFPRRAVLPDRLVKTLPGLFGESRLASEERRLENRGLPVQKIAGVSTGANMAQPEDWINPLRGYSYDSFNPDALLNLAYVKNGRVAFKGGADYALLVLPTGNPLEPNSNVMTAETAQKLLRLINDGATVLLGQKPNQSPGFENYKANDSIVQQIAHILWEGNFQSLKDGDATVYYKNIGKGRVLKGPYQASSLQVLGIERDLIVTDSAGLHQEDIAWTHRSSPHADIYFVSNQQAKKRQIHVSFRVAGKVPLLYDAVSGTHRPVNTWKAANGRTSFPLHLNKNESLFIIFETDTDVKQAQSGENWIKTREVKMLSNPWNVTFDEKVGGPKGTLIFNKLTDWSTHSDSLIRYYSGTADYTTEFNWKATNSQRIFLDIGDVKNLAEIEVNGVDCGVIWTYPYRLDITEALKTGKNTLSIKVTNTWANRLIGDQNLPQEQKITNTTAPYRLDGNLLEAGLFGPVRLLIEQ